MPDLLLLELLLVLLLVLLLEQLLVLLLVLLLVAMPGLLGRDSTDSGRLPRSCTEHCCNTSCAAEKMRRGWRSNPPVTAAAKSQKVLLVLGFYAGTFLRGHKFDKAVKDCLGKERL